MKKDPQQPQQHNKLVRRLLLLTLAMFGFGYALVPLYNVFCDITGLNGKNYRRQAYTKPDAIDYSREVTVEFLANTGDGMSWEFRPMTPKVKVHPGELTQVDFYARNPTEQTVHGQAIPSITPGASAVYLNKIECFCFNSQVLKAGEEVEMSLQFYVDPELPEKYHTLTLSYTLFDITGRNAEKIAM